MHRNVRTITAALFAALSMAAVAHSALDNTSLDNSGYAGALETAKAGTAKFQNLAVAKKAGYGLLKDKKGISCIAMDTMPGMAAGAMGVHYANGALVGDGALSFDTPEALVDEPLASGKLKLAALEYVVLKAAWDAKHATEPVMFGHKFNETYGGNRFGLPAFYSLHVWLFKHNPSGQFAMWNPRVHCGSQS
jgi:hypothetical protein